MEIPDLAEVMPEKAAELKRPLDLEASKLAD
jgi:hypothetical protein